MEACPVCRLLSPPPAGPSIGAAPRPVEADEWDRDDRIRGLFLGMAIGDGIGAQRHGGGAFPASLRPGGMTTGGATSLGLFTTDGLVRMAVRYDLKGIGPAWELIRHALRRWASTRVGPAGSVGLAGDGSSRPCGWLAIQHVLHQPIEGFGATVSAIRSELDVAFGFQEGREPRQRVNDSAGAGALVRVASAGALFSPADALLVGSVAGAYTHGATDGYLAGGALARIAASLLAGNSLDEAVAETLAELAAWPGSERVARALRAPRQVDGDRAVRSLASGVHEARGRGEPMEVIERAAETGGTAAAVVAGAIVGSRCGAMGLPAAWRTAPDAVAVIDEVATTVSVAHRAYVMGRRIPGWEPLSDSILEGHPASRWLVARG